MSAAAAAPIDWAALIRVRERRMQHERERCALARRSAGEATRALGRAAELHAQRAALCAAHAQRMRDDGACRASALHEGCGLARRLDALLVQARHDEQAAREGCAAARLSLAARLHTLRAAAAELRAAQLMQQRQHQTQSRRREHRAAELLDDAARQRWLHAPRQRM